MAISALAAVLLFVAALLVLQLPFVRARLFDFAVRELATRYNLDLQATRLDYNLLSRRVTLTDVRLAARGHERDPFLTARRVEAAVPWSIFRGVLAFNRIELEGALVSMVRYDESSANLPAGRGVSDPNRAALRLDVRGLAIDGLDFAYVDRVRGMQIAAGDLHADLSSGRVGGLPGVSGPIEIRKGVRLVFGEREIIAQPISGSMAFDGSNIALQAVGLRTAEGSVVVDGRIDRVLDRPALDLRLDGEADVARAAAWGTLPVALDGSTKVTGTISGPAASPTIHLVTNSNTLAIGDVSAIDAQTEVTITTDAVVVDKARLRAGGGVVDAVATIPFGDDQPLKANADWRGLEARTALRLARLADRPIAATLTGTLQYERTANRPLTLRIRNRSVSAPSAVSAPSPAVPLEGDLALEVAGGGWQVRQQHAIPQTLTVKGDLNGRVEGTAFSTATLDGRLDTTIDDVARASQAIERLGLDLPAIAGNITGLAHADVTLAGRLDAVETKAIVDSTALSLPGLAPAVMHAEIDTNAAAVHVSNASAAVGSARLAGNASIDLRSRQLSGAFDLDAPDVAELLAEAPGGLELRGPVTAKATLAGTTAEPQVIADLNGEGIDVSGQRIDTLVAHARVTGDQIAVDSFEARQREGDLSGSGSYAWGTRAYTADLQGSNLSWSGSLIGSTESTVRLTTLRYAGSGTVDRPGGEATAAFEITGGIAGTLVGQGSTTAHFMGEAAAVTVQVPSLGAFIDGKIATRAPYAYDALAVVNRLDLSALAPLADVPSNTIAGTVSLSATANGDVTDVASSQVFLNLQDVMATVSEVPVSLVAPSRLSWQQSTLSVDALELQVGQGRLQASGALARSGPSRWDTTFNGELGDLVRMSRAFGAPPDLNAGGQVTAHWQSTGSLDASTATVQLAAGTLAWGDIPPVTALTLQANVDGRTINVPTLTGTWQDGGIQGSATVPRAIVEGSAARGTVEPGRAELRVAKLNAAAFGPWLAKETLNRLQGQLSATLDAEILGSRLEDVRATLTLDEAAFTVASVDAHQTRPTRIALDYAFATLEDVAWTVGGSPLILTGNIGLASADAPVLNVALAGDMDLRVLGAFAPNVVTDGDASVNLWTYGPPKDPRLTGRVELKDASFALRDPRIVIGPVNGPVVLDGSNISFDGVAGTANGGDLSLHGRLTMEGLAISGGQLVAQIQRMALEFPEDLQSEISALVTLTPQKTDWVLGGDVRVERSAYTEPVSLAAMAAARRSQPPVVSRDGPSWRDQLRLNLFVVTEEDLRLDNNYGRIEAGAAVRLVGTVARPGLTGQVTLREGGQFYLAGNTFHLERGSISFASTTRIEPEIDIEARALVSGRDILLTMSGTLADLKTDVRSNDPTVSDREAREALYGGLVGDEQALTLLSGELLGVTGRALGLDALRLERGFETEEFRADPTLIATETDPSTRLTLSKRLRPEVELILSQSLSESGALSAIISYKPLRNVELRATSRDNIDRSFSIRHEITFGGSGTTRASAALQPRIIAIRVLGTPGRPEAEIRRDLRLDEGDRFDFHRWQRDVDDIREEYLRDGYYEARVRPIRDISPDGSSVALDYRIDRGPRTTLVVEGHPLHAGLVRELEDAWTRAIFDQFLLDEIRTRITRHLLEENWIESMVEARVAESTSEQKVVRVTISPGTQVAKREIRYSGNMAVSTDRLEATVERAGLDVAGWLDPARVTTAIEAYYRDLGYLSARATAAEPTLEGNTGVLPVAVDEGPRFILADTRFAGVAERRQPFLDRAVRILSKGDPYDRLAVDRMADQIERAYRRRGFNNVQVESRADVDTAGGTVTITFDVQEGPQQILRDVSTEGATRTRSDVIRRALRLEAGEPVNLEQWSQARKRMYDTNVFRQVDIEPVPMEQTPDDQTAGVQPMRAVVRVIEYPVWRLRYGGQYREEKLEEEIEGGTRRQGLGLLADLQNQNLFGLAVTGGVAVSYQPWRQATSIFASNGSFFGLPVRSHMFVFGVREEEPPNEFFDIVTDRVGFSAEQRWRPFRQAEATYGYRFERAHVYDRDPNPDAPIDATGRSGRLTSAFYVDRRNDPFNAGRGWFSSVNYEQAAPWLGSDVANSRLLLQQFYYREVGPLVWASAARVGVAYRVEEIIDPEDRFLAGGGTTVRGYAEDALGPRDLAGRPLGGGGLLILNQEIRFPIRGRVGGVAFVDAGNVWLNRSDISFGDLELGYGFGLRLNTPFALLRVDYGIPGSSIPATRGTGFTKGRWYFGIGQAF